MDFIVPQLISRFSFPSIIDERETEPVKCQYKIYAYPLSLLQPFEQTGTIFQWRGIDFNCLILYIQSFVILIFLIVLRMQYGYQSGTLLQRRYQLRLGVWMGSWVQGSISKYFLIYIFSLWSMLLLSIKILVLRVEQIQYSKFEEKGIREQLKDQGKVEWKKKKRKENRKSIYENEKIKLQLAANQKSTKCYSQKNCYYFKFKMEIHQPNSMGNPTIHNQNDFSELGRQDQPIDSSMLLDFNLQFFISQSIPPFVVTKDYKIRREQISPELESDIECNNIQDKILNYNRKDKSLMELTRKFIQKFEGGTSNVLVLDQVTQELNVQRRRIYDIINIMESLSVVSKIRKNVYQWKGLRKAVETIEYLNNGNYTTSCEKGRKEKSLQSLAGQFLKLFCQRNKYMTLEEASQIILRQAPDQVKKTKIRRLYDIVNVFKCLGLVEKVKLSREGGGKPIYTWLGHQQLIKIIQQKQRLIKEEEAEMSSQLDQNKGKKQDGFNMYIKREKNSIQIKINKKEKTGKIIKCQQNNPIKLKDISNIYDPTCPSRPSFEKDKTIASEHSPQYKVNSFITPSVLQGSAINYDLLNTNIEEDDLDEEKEQRKREDRSAICEQQENKSYFVSLIKMWGMTAKSPIQEIQSTLIRSIWSK